MTRSDLVAQLAERFGQLTHRDTEFAVKTIASRSAVSAASRSIAGRRAWGATHAAASR